MKKIIQISFILFCCCNLSYGQHEKDMGMQNMKMNNVKPLDIAMIEKVTGMKGKENNGQYKITVPQNDLNVTVDGFKIIPAIKTPNPKIVPIIGK